MTYRLDPSLDNYCVMGNPIAHSKSPQIHQAFAEQTHQKLFYQAILVDENGFSEALHAFQKQGGKGLNITVPFKGEAWQSMDEFTERARKAEAVNTIWFSEDGKRHGDTTDGIGLINDLLRHEVSLANKRVLILGAGGAVRSVLADMVGEQPGTITIANRTLSRAEELVRQFSEVNILNAIPLEQLSANQFDVVINGTSASLKGELLPLPDNILAEGACCYDMVYGDTDTVFVTWAKQHGAAKAVDGLGMLVEQAAESFFIWRGVRPETGPVIEMLRKG